MKAATSQAGARDRAVNALSLGFCRFVLPVGHPVSVGCGVASREIWTVGLDRGETVCSDYEWAVVTVVKAGEKGQLVQGAASNDS